MEIGLVISLILTVVILFRMFRPITGGSDDLGLGAAFEVLCRLFYIIPILFVWLVYFIVN